MVERQVSSRDINTSACLALEAYILLVVVKKDKITTVRSFKSSRASCMNTTFDAFMRLTSSFRSDASEVLRV